MATKFFAHLRGNNITSSPVAMKAQSIVEAKDEAWNLYSDGYRDHWIEICEAATFEPNDEVEAGAPLLMRRLSDRAWQTIAVAA